MKKILSSILAVTFMFSGISAFAEIDTKEMEQSLICVKNKVQIPEALTEFESGLHDDVEENEKYYYFSWAAEDGSTNLSVSADASGGIREYNYYDNDMYKKQKRLSEKTRQEYFEVAEAFLKDIAPEWFSDENDCLKLINFEKTIVNDCRATFSWERSKGGVSVPSNNASVSVIYDGEDFIIERAVINTDNDAAFEELSGEGLTSVRDVYFDAYPLELVYYPEWNYDAVTRKSDVTQKLRYMFKNSEMGYISAVDGKKVTEDVRYHIYEEGRNESASDNMITAGKGISPAERAELDNISGLVSADEIIKKLTEMKVFGKIPSKDKLSCNIRKTDEGYIMTLFCYEDKFSLTIDADAESGMITSVYSYDYSKRYEEKEMTDAEKKKAKEIVTAFLDKYYKDEMTEFEKLDESSYSAYNVSANRLINGVKAFSDSVNVTYDPERGVISGFSLSMTKDTSVFPLPENIIDEAGAEDSVLREAPLKLMYIKSDGVYKLCWKPDGHIYDIDAFTGEVDMQQTWEFDYSDISGHWAEKEITALAECGIGKTSIYFNPDDAITQKGILQIMHSSFYYDIQGRDIYDVISEDILSKEDKNPDGNVLREDAFVFMTSFMNLSEIAALNDIFKTDFADNSNISPEKIGSAAILRGYGIISGDGKNVRPKDNITNAEVAVMLYNYLTKN